MLIATNYANNVRVGYVNPNYGELSLLYQTQMPFSMHVFQSFNIISYKSKRWSDFFGESTASNRYAAFECASSPQ